MFIFYLIIFLISSFLLAVSCKCLINSLIHIAKFLEWKEFVVSFCTMALAVSLPNFFLGFSSVFYKVPELSLGDVIGGNIVDLTLVIGLCALISKMGLSTSSRTVQGSAIFTFLIAILPLILIFDGNLNRSDGFLLLLGFFIYVFWLFKKKERFVKIYDEEKKILSLSFFLKNFFNFLGSVILLILASHGMVKSAIFFAHFLNIPLALIGILIIGFGNSLPETFFSLQAARKSEDWFILGNLMGGVIITTTLVLGIVAILSPIKISDFFTIAMGRFFLALSAAFFWFFLYSSKKITKKEGIFLLGIFILFIILEILEILKI